MCLTRHCTFELLFLISINLSNNFEPFVLLPCSCLLLLIRCKTTFVVIVIVVGLAKVWSNVNTIILKQSNKEYRSLKRKLLFILQTQTLNYNSTNLYNMELVESFKFFSPNKSVFSKKWYLLFVDISANSKNAILNRFYNWTDVCWIFPGSLRGDVDSLSLVSIAFVES